MQTNHHRNIDIVKEAYITRKYVCRTFFGKKKNAIRLSQSSLRSINHDKTADNERNDEVDNAAAMMTSAVSSPVAAKHVESSTIIDQSSSSSWLAAVPSHSVVASSSSSSSTSSMSSNVPKLQIRSITSVPTQYAYDT